MGKLRFKSLVIAIVFLLLITPVLYYATINAGEGKSAENIGVKAPEFFAAPYLWSRQNGSVPWFRENVFLNSNMYLRQGGGYDLNTPNAENVKNNPKPFKVLLFGDSYAWGNGADDPQINIAWRLQEELNRLTKPNTFVVILKAANGRNTFSYVDYFTKDKVKSIEPDIAIYDYVYNDQFPNFEESMICPTVESCKDRYSPAYHPKYRACVAGKSGFLGRAINIFVKPLSNNTASLLLVRYCQPLLKKINNDTFNEERYILHPKENPYYQTWIDAVKRLKSNFGDTPLYFVNSKISNQTFEIYDETSNVFKKSGYKIIDSPWLNNVTNQVINDKKWNLMNKMYVTPYNAHYSLYANYNFAIDIANKIISDLGKEKIDSLMKANTSSPGPFGLINSTTPYLAKFTNLTADDAIVQYDPKEQEGKYRNQGELPFQGTSCLYIGHPYFLINIDHHKFKENFQKIKVKVDNPNLRVGYLIYDKEFNKSFLTDVKETNGEYVINRDTGNFSYAVVVYDPNSDCSLDKVIDLPKFSADVSLA